MRLTLTPTAEIARVRTGTNEAGTEVRAWIAVVQPQTHDEARCAAFAAALRELPRPNRATVFDMRFLG